MIPVALIPAATASAVLGGVFLVARPLPWMRRYLPEILVITVIVATLAMGFPPVGTARLALWQAALWSPSVFGLVLLALWSQVARRPEDAGPARAQDALALGLVIGWLPTTALLGPRTRGPGHAARLAVIATAASAISPLGGPIPLVLSHGDPAWSAWVALPSLACILVAWPWSDRPRLPARDLRLLGPGLLGIAVAWTVGPLAGVAVAAVLGIALRRRSESPTPPGLADLRPLRLALAAWLVAAFATVSGAAWAVAWFPNHGGQVDIQPLWVTWCAAGAAILVEPFSAAALIQRAIAYPSAPAALAGLTALPLALSPIAAIGVVTASQGWRVWKTGIWLTIFVFVVALWWSVLVPLPPLS